MTGRVHTSPNKSFNEALVGAIWGEMGKVHTCLPAIVNSYDPSGPEVEIQLAVRKVVLSSGEEISIPPIVAVPVIFPRTTKFRLTYPLSAGDTGLALFSERSIAEFLASGKEVTPLNFRKYAITDAMFLPGLTGFGAGMSIEDGTKMELVFNNAKLVSDGSGFEFTGDLKVNGKVTASGDVLAGSVSLDNHIHKNGTLTYVNSAGAVTPISGAIGAPT